MASTSRANVPDGVRFVAYFAAIIGIIELIVGIVVIAARNDVDGFSSGQALAVGIALLIVGAIYLLVSRGLLHLAGWALFVGLFFSGLKAAWDVVALIAFGIDGLGFGVIVSLAISLIVFFALWSGRDAFEDGPAPASA